MDELGYQYLLSKCIQDGPPGGMYSKLSSTLQKKAEATALSSENSRSGSTSGAAEGSPELGPGNRVIIGMDGTAMDKRRSSFFATSKSAGTTRMRGRALRMEDMIANRYHRSFLRSGDRSPSIFSFRSLLEGALTVSEIKPPIVVQKSVELGIRSAPIVDLKKDSVSADKHPPADERLFRERHDGGRRVPHSRCDHSAEGVAELGKGNGNLAHRVCDSGSLSETIGDSGPHVSYSSLLQAQLEHDVDKVRTETPLKTSKSFVEAHSSELNLHVHSTEVEGGFMPVSEMTSPLLFSIAGQASFPAADGEQMSNVYSEEPSHASSGVELPSADKALLGDTSVAMPPIFDEDVSRVEVVDEENSLVAGSRCTDQQSLDLQLRKVDDTAVVGDEARTTDIPLGRSFIESGEEPSPALPRSIEEHVPQAEVVANRGSFGMAEAMFVDQMSDAQLPEELARVLVADESPFVEKNLNGDAMYSSKAAVVSVPHVPTDLEEIDARELVAMDRTTLGVAEAESTDERLLATQLSEEPSCIFGTDEADNALYRDFPESSVAVAVAVPLKSSPVSEVVLEEESNRLNSNALVEKSSFRSSISSSGQLMREEPHPTFGHSGSNPFCSEGMSESVKAAAVLESAWKACTDSTEDTNSIIGGDLKDNYRRTQVLKDSMRLDGVAINEDLIGGVDGNGPHRSCMSSVQLTSASVSPDDSGNSDDMGRIYIDARNEMERVTEDQPACSREVFKQAEFEQCKATASTDLAPEMQIVVSQFSVSQAVNMEFVICGTRHESDEFPTVEADLRKEGRTAPETLVGKIVNNATDSGISSDPVDQVLCPDPGVISEGLKQVFLGNSDTTISDSLESAQATGAELIPGKEVQSLSVTKSRATFARRLVDLQVNRILRPQGLGKPLSGHFDENEEQRCVSPLNGIGYDQLLDVEVRPYEKKVRHCAYILEKATQGTGISCFHPLGSQGIIELQTAGSRCRRNRHINPEQPVPVFVEGRDEGFEEADGGSFLRWLARLDESSAGPVPALGKRIRNNGEESSKFMIAIPLFRVFSDYEDRQQEVEKRRKLRMLSQPISSSYSTPVSLSTLNPPEYDMDDEDERWLHAWNKNLARSGLEQLISEEKFEEMIEYFERRSAEVIVPAVGFFSGSPRCGKSLGQPSGGRLLPRKCPSGLGLLSTNPATSGTPLSISDSPTLAIQPGEHTLADGLENGINLRRHGFVYPSIHVDRFGKSADPPATMVRHRMLISESERNPSYSNVDTVCESLSEGSLRNSFEASALEKLCNECCICNGGEDGENNPVYTCKQCLIHVHQSCYGIREKFRDNGGRLIAPLNWCCRKCEAVAAGRAQPNVSCALCRKRGGALKPTVAAQIWAHIVCALYTNETFFVDPDAMEPIDGIAAVMARGHERQERCGLCGVKKGICSFCDAKDCRAPFHISCGVSQGASFELRQSKLKVVGVRSFCPRHGRITATELAPSAELKDGQLNSSSTSEATASATASGTISRASSMDDREEWSSRQSVSHPNRSFGHLAKTLCKDVADLTENVMSANGRGLEDADRVLSKSIRFTLKRKWNESCDQASEVRLFSVCQTKCGDKTEVGVGKEEGPGWQVVEPGQKLKKIKFKFGRLAQNPDMNSSPILVQQEMVSRPAKMKDVGSAGGEVHGSSGVKEKEADILKGLSEDRFAREVKELLILEEATKSGLAPGNVLREAFVYWRAKRAEFEGSLLCELHHEQWLRSQGIFNKEASDEERCANGKTVSNFLRVAEAQQPSVISIEKTYEIAKEIRMQLERVRLMAQMVVQREKLKCNHQVVLGSIASAELTQGGAAPDHEGPHCFWCPSIRTLLKCGNCARSFCFNCFKHRKGFGVKGWMAAMKAPIYICKYCRESSNEPVDLSNDMDPSSLEKIGEGGAVSSSPGGESARGVVSHANLRIPTDAASLEVVCNLLTDPGIHVAGDGIPAGISTVGKEIRGQGGRWYSSGNGTEGGGIKDILERGCEGTASWTGIRDDLRRGSEPGAEKKALQCKPSHRLEDGLNQFLSSSAQRGMEQYSNFESTLRKLKILDRCRNTSPQQELLLVTNCADEIPSAGVPPGPNMSEEMEDRVTSSTTIDSNVPVSYTFGSGPALLVYKKKRRGSGSSPEPPPCAYDVGDQPSSPTRLDIMVPQFTSPRPV